MPNHVTSSVQILGSKQDVEKIKKQLESTEDGNVHYFDFENVIPMPADISKGNISFEEKKASNGRNWYDWSVDNWGTKWNSYSQVLPHEIKTSNSFQFITGDDTHMIKYFFDTAWSPASPVIQELSNQHPNVFIKFSFIDEGGAFGGHEYYRNGVMYLEDVTEPLDEEISAELYSLIDDRPASANELIYELQEVFDDFREKYESA